MRNSKSITKNALLNATRTLLSIFFPLITYPYVTRVLHSENLGKVTFAQSIVSYFALVAALGISTYAVREGAKLKDNNVAFRSFCNEVFSTNIITTIIAYILLFFTVILIPLLRNYIVVIVILSSSLFFTTMGIDWINVIFEDYYIITIRSIVVQIVNLVLLFVFVKDENDYYIYAFLLVFSNIVVCVWNYIYCRKYIRLKFIIKCSFQKHIKPLLVFFANNLAISIYCYSDTTMIGWYLGDECVGVYSVAVKAYTVIKTLLASIYTVCIPRLSYYYGSQKYEDFNNLVGKVINGLILLIIPGMVGLSLYAKIIILFLGGVEYADAIGCLKILSLALGIAVFSGVLSNCVNIPTGKERITLIGTSVAAICNIIMNIFMIPIMRQQGAALTTVVAELVVIIVCFFYNKNIKSMIQWKKLLQNCAHSLVGCAFIFGCNYLLKSIITNIYFQCVLTTILTVVLYGLFLFFVKNETLLYFLNLLNKKSKSK